MLKFFDFTETGESTRSLSSKDFHDCERMKAKEGERGREKDVTMSAYMHKCVCVYDEGEREEGREKEGERGEREH